MRAAITSLALLLVCLALAGEAHADQPACSITATNVAFGSYSASSPMAGIGTINVSCNRGESSLPLTISPATGRVMLYGSNSLYYNLYIDGAHTTIWGDGSSGTTTSRIDVTTACGSGMYCGTATVYRLIPSGQISPRGDYSQAALTATVSGYGGPVKQVSSFFSVTATVIPACTISAVGTMDFGSLGLSFTNADKSGISANISYSCDFGLNATITLDQGRNPDSGSSDALPLRRMRLGAGSNYISYSLYMDSSYGQVWGNTSATGLRTIGTGFGQTATVYGRATHANVPAGSYSDIVVVTISF